jgi:uncharacterized membrane protein YphA (DoxX/SURF4 family)
MHILTIGLTAVLAIILAAAGIPKILNPSTAQKNAEHLRIPANLSRAIGVLELAATAGLLVGFAVTPLGVAAAAGVCALMIGAVASHIRAHDSAQAMAPALVVTILAGAVLALQITS